MSTSHHNQEFDVELPKLDPSEYAPGFLDHLHVNDAPIRVSEFVSKGIRYKIEPALIFRWGYNTELNCYEIFGFKTYRNILVYADELREARDILVNDILPLFWERFANKDDFNLTVSAQAVKHDLSSRIKLTCRSQREK